METNQVTITDILATVDCFSNLDGCYEELKKALSENFKGGIIVD